MRTRVRRWRWGSDWSPGTASFGGGTGSSRRLRRRGGGAAVSRQSPGRAGRAIAALEKAVAGRWRSATARWPRWSNAGRPPSRRDTPRSPPSATRAKRPAPSMSQPQRLSGSRRSEQAWPALGPRAGARSRARGRRAAERSLGGLPDPAALEHQVRGRGPKPLRPPRRLPTSAPKPRPRRARPPPIVSVERRTARAGRMAQARRRSRAKARPRRSSGRSAVGRTVGIEREPAELDVRSPSSNAPTTRARCGSAKPRPPSARPRKPSSPRRMKCPRPTSARPIRASAGRSGARAEAQQARSAEFARTSVEKFECVPQRLPESSASTRTNSAMPKKKRRCSSG